MTRVSTEQYFLKKATRYDDVDKQLYWVLSDQLLWNSLTALLDKLPGNFIFLDAGGGTGRWTEKILRHYPNSSGVLYDLSESMLEVAAKKLTRFIKMGRLRVIHGNIERATELKANTFDVSFNFHNVIGFVDNPLQFIQKLASVTKPNRFVITFAPNYYHAIYFNISIGNVIEAKRIMATHRGKFTSDMPNIHFFTPQSLQNIYDKAHLKIEKLTGFPSTIYPNFKETQLSGQTTTLAKLLSARSTLRAIIDIEKKIGDNTEISARGNNIYIAGTKTS